MPRDKTELVVVKPTMLKDSEQDLHMVMQDIVAGLMVAGAREKHKTVLPTSTAKSLPHPQRPRTGQCTHTLHFPHRSASRGRSGRLGHYEEDLLADLCQEAA